MLELKESLILYHGSYCEVVRPNLRKCAKRKEFGQGFYLTSSKEQAENFLKISINKARAIGRIEEGQNYGYISIFEFSSFKKLNIHVFPEASVDWLHCIAAHRKNTIFIEEERKLRDVDIIIGKIADDATNASLTAYLAGAFGIVGEKETDEFCIKQLLSNKLKDQYCFKTEDALSCLKFIESEKIWLS